MPTKEEFKRLSKKTKLKVRKGDSVVVIAGKDKGQRGFIAAVSPKEQKVIVLQENPDDANSPIPLNAVIKHHKDKQGGGRSARIKLPAPIHISNIMVIDPKLGEPTKIGRKLENGKIVRYAKKSGETIIDQSNLNKNS